MHFRKTIKTTRVGRTGVSPVQEFTTQKRKLPHWQSPGKVFFITVSATSGIEFSPEDRDVILNNCLFWHNKKYILYAVVVMSDHVHMLLQPQPLDQKNEAKGYYNLSEIMHGIKGFAAHKINEFHQRKGSIWLAESYDRIAIETRKSSKRNFATFMKTPLKIAWLRTRENINGFGCPQTRRLQHHR